MKKYGVEGRAEAVFTAIQICRDFDIQKEEIQSLMDKLLKNHLGSNFIITLSDDSNGEEVPLSNLFVRNIVHKLSATANDFISIGKALTESLRKNYISVATRDISDGTFLYNLRDSVSDRNYSLRIELLNK